MDSYEFLLSESQNFGATRTDSKSFSAAFECIQVGVNIGEFRAALVSLSL